MYVLPLGLRRYLNMIGEGSGDKMSLSANGIINYKRYVADFHPLNSNSAGMPH